MVLHENGSRVWSKNEYPRTDSDAGEEEIASGCVIKTTNIEKCVIDCAIFVTLNSVIMGYGGSQDYQKFRNEVLVGILSIISLLGSLAGGRTFDSIGQKWIITFAAITIQSGSVVMALSTSFGILMIGRLLAGIRIGFGLMIVPAYIRRDITFCFQRIPYLFS